ncbi:nucleotidyltransferase domain-containing protein [Limnothrix sp. FACHB-881]|nr:nucleotidyltransferase domain-containing protein [Limnothrix sp. FACHB-881]MBD2635966.1 nucleotidyltransferase domain-containing protein [Limnothrix sp. FACHB-881]
MGFAVTAQRAFHGVNLHPSVSLLYQSHIRLTYDQNDDFCPDSDIDVLVSFAPTAQRGLTETLQIRDELEALFGRPVDLLVKAAIDRLTISNFSQAII